MKSMTGFGRGHAAAGGLAVDVELSTVNRKQFDARVNLPRQLAEIEPRVAELIRGAISRGAVTVTVKLTVSGAARAHGIRVDAAAARAWVAALRQAAAGLDLRDDLGLRDLLALPDVVRFEALPADTEWVWGLVRRGLLAALRELDRMRRREGRALARDLAGRVRALRALLGVVRRHAPRAVARYRRNLVRRVRAAGVGLAASDPQVVREVVLFADRSDISEELVRLQSHFGQAGTLARAREPVGRALDFLCQEMLREINTIGSKSNDAAIAAAVVQFKATLESVREQVQNVE